MRKNLSSAKLVPRVCPFAGLTCRNGHTLGTSLQPIPLSYIRVGLYSEVHRIRERNGLCSQFSYNYFLDNIASCKKFRCKLQQNCLVYHGLDAKIIRASGTYNPYPPQPKKLTYVADFCLARTDVRTNGLVF